MTTIALLAILATIICCVQSAPVTNLEKYRLDRANLIGSELCMRLGRDIVLNAQESILDQYILKEKRRTMEDSRLNRTSYIPAVSFYLSKSWIEQTNIFKIIKAMPKGATLHLHDLAMGGLDWVVKNATYRDNVYMCRDANNTVYLTLIINPPPNPGCEWKLVQAERANVTNVTEFDESIRKSLSLLTTDPLQTFPSVDLVWDRFNLYFSQVAGLLINVDVMRDYFRQTLGEFMADNVQYVEMRGQIAWLTEANGTMRDGDYGVNLYKEVAEEFTRNNPDKFSGAKIIMSSLRLKNKTSIFDDVKMAKDLHAKYPNFFLGYDLVGQEDPLHPLLFYIEELLSANDGTQKLPFFFHAAETNWQGTDVDYNLVDALLLNTTRIGHGFGLVKHPKLVELVKARGVAVEVNPLSNQLLGLVKDLRNHAMAPLIAQNLPIVFSSDDPGCWEALPMTHDIYAAFMNLMGQDAGLASLKQMAINSLQYSGMNSTDKEKAMALWRKNWDQFVNETIQSFQLVADNSTAINVGPSVCETTPTTLPPIVVTTQKGNSATTTTVLHIAMVALLLVNIIANFD